MLSYFWEANSYSLAKEIPICGTRKVITVFTRVRHWFLYWDIRIHFISPHSISSEIILILSYNQCPGFPSSLLSSVLPKLLKQLSSHRLCYTPCPSHPQLYYYNMWWGVQVIKFVIMGFLRHPVALEFDYYRDLKHCEPVFWFYGARSFVHYIFQHQTRRQIILNWTVVRIPQI